MKFIIYFSILLSASSHVYGQVSTVSGSGTGTGPGGTSTFSIGQLSVNINTGSQGFVTPGTQQPLEISVITGTRNTEIIVKVKVYPNPVKDVLILKTGNTPLSQLQYVITDTQGKTISAGRINNTTTTIFLNRLTNGTYILNVFRTNQILKSFKVIKNK